ncbi:nuclear transport factor 2 family protein [Bradyrhizobium sp. AUGA SZCCT0176]|nr:nuclear transport factor 2 family protein [Bradyrhizobium sp. AUGA SZCCT0176]MBR1301330.1 nuclear transport factor 2 family protein [Bradyrhizobium sp. AUGA SZCCT0042]
MADREAMRKLVEQAYADRGSGNIEGLMSAFHADAVFELAGEPKVLALAGTVRSHPNVREAMTGFIGAFQFIERDIIAFIADGDRAAVHSRLTMRFKDITFTTELTDLFKFQDGKIIELVEFADTALIKEITAGA